MHLSDGFDRTFRYLRLSITEVCNFQCKYCLPNGYKKQTGPSVLSQEELIRAARAFSELGLSKIRLTGGEPTTRKDFTEIAQQIADLPKVKSLALTTNGYQLAQKAGEWRDAGITAINLSIDSLEPEKFREITGHDRCQDVLAGLNAAIEAGFKTVKVNVVYMRGINDHEIDAFIDLARNKPISVRFIELMETGDHARFFKTHHKPVEAIAHTRLSQGWSRKLKPADAGPSQDFTHPDYKGSFGLIAPYSKDFCKSCNRLRVSSKGDLHLCLFGNFGIPMRSLLQTDDQSEELKIRIKAAIRGKTAGHALQFGKTGVTQNLSAIGG